MADDDGAAFRDAIAAAILSQPATSHRPNDEPDHHALAWAVEEAALWSPVAGKLTRSVWSGLVSKQQRARFNGVMLRLETARIKSLRALCDVEALGRQAMLDRAVFGIAVGVTVQRAAHVATVKRSARERQADAHAAALRALRKLRKRTDDFVERWHKAPYPTRGGPALREHLFWAALDAMEAELQRADPAGTLTQRATETKDGVTYELRAAAREINGVLGALTGGNHPAFVAGLLHIATGDNFPPNVVKGWLRRTN